MTPDPENPTRPRLSLPPDWKDPPPPTEEEMRAMDEGGLTLSDAIRILEAEFGSFPDEEHQRPESSTRGEA